MTDKNICSRQSNDGEWKDVELNQLRIGDKFKLYSNILEVDLPVRLEDHFDFDLDRYGTFVYTVASLKKEETP